MGHSPFLGQSLKGDKWGWPDAYWIWGKRSPGFEEAIVSWLAERVEPAWARRSGRMSCH